MNNNKILSAFESEVFKKENLYVYIDSPVLRLPRQDKFQLNGWIISPHAVSTASVVADNVNVELELHSRSDVEKDFPDFSFIKGFSCFIPLHLRCLLLRVVKYAG